MLQASLHAEAGSSEAGSAVATVFKLVSPTGVLHFVPRLNRPQETQVALLAKKHALRPAYLKDILGLGWKQSDEHMHWQPLDKVRFLQHIESGVVVVVVGGPQHFVNTIDAIRESAGFRNDEMKLINFDRVAWLLRPYRSERLVGGALLCRTYLQAGAD